MLDEDVESELGKERPLVWMPQSITTTCLNEATNKYSLESGGTFMGYWVDSETVVVRHMIGPGPDAFHGRHRFQPDEAWQHEKIARHYAASGRRDTYLGDWHSHPNASSGTLSWIDRRVLRRIIRTPSARCPTPLMMVFWGQPDDWLATVWRGTLRRRSILWPSLTLTQVSIRVS